MKAYSAFLSDVMPEVPDCPLFLAENHVRNAAIEFCDLSSVWRYETAPDLIGGDESYSFDPPSGSVVARVIQAWVNGDEVFPKSASELNSIYSDWRSAVGSAKYITSITPREYKIVPNPSPSDDQKLSLLVALKPTRTSTTCPDFLLEDYIEEIAHGAKARLKEISDKPWTNTSEAIAHRGKFMMGVMRAQSRAELGFGRTSPVVKPREFV